MKYTTLSIRTPELDRGCQQRKPMEKKTGKDPSYGMGDYHVMNNTHREKTDADDRSNGGVAVPILLVTLTSPRGRQGRVPYISSLPEMRPCAR